MALHENLTLLRLVKAVNAFGQGGFAGTVFTQLTMNLTRSDIDVNLINGNDSMKFFGQCLCAQQWFHLVPIY
jgi:hypothetical protein